ncbi:restriction endonuclease [Streptomyces lydicus]
MDDRQFEQYVAELCRRGRLHRRPTRRRRRRPGRGRDRPTARRPPPRYSVQALRQAPHLGSRDLQTFNGTARAEHRADVPVSVAPCVFAKPAHDFAARHDLWLIDVNLLGFWNSAP